MLYLRGVPRTRSQALQIAYMSIFEQLPQSERRDELIKKLNENLDT